MANDFYPLPCLSAYLFWSLPLIRESREWSERAKLKASVSQSASRLKWKYGGSGSGSSVVGGGCKRGTVVGTMTSSLRGCPGNGKHSPRRDADARRHRRKNQFRPWLGDRSVLARRCCDAASSALSGEATRTTLLWRCRAADCHHRTTSESHKLGAASQAPAVASGQLIERLLHRGACDGTARAKAHTTHAFTLQRTRITGIHNHHVYARGYPRVRTGARDAPHHAVEGTAVEKSSRTREERVVTRAPSSFGHGKTRARVRIAVRTSLWRIVEADA